MKKIFNLRSVLFCGLVFIFILQSCNRSGNGIKPSESIHSAQDEFWCVPEVQDKNWYTSGKKAPLFSGLEGIHFSITTKSIE
jgi:hypothetical protein